MQLSADKLRESRPLAPHRCPLPYKPEQPIQQPHNQNCCQWQSIGHRHPSRHINRVRLNIHRVPQGTTRYRQRPHHFVTRSHPCAASMALDRASRIANVPHLCRQHERYLQTHSSPIRMHLIILVHVCMIQLHVGATTPTHCYNVLQFFSINPPLHVVCQK